jgi:hypothetical protein
MPVTHTQFPDYVTLHHDAEAQPEPAVMVWFMNGVPTTCHRNTGESMADFWKRVRDYVTDERLRLQRTRSLLDPLAHCDVYAGELAPDCLAALEKRHMRNHILSALQRESGAPASTGATGGSRTRALLLLGKMTGTVKPRRKVVKTEHLPNE